MREATGIWAWWVTAATSHSDFYKWTHNPTTGGRLRNCCPGEEEAQRRTLYIILKSAFLPGEFHGQRSLTGQWGHNMTVKAVLYDPREQL